MSSASGGSGGDPLRVAFAGNSFIYYNDLPRVFEAFFAPGSVVTTSCLRGGTTLTSLCDLGNGMGKKFATANGLLPDGGYDVGVSTVASSRQPSKTKATHHAVDSPTSCRIVATGCGAYLDTPRALTWHRLRTTRVCCTHLVARRHHHAHHCPAPHPAMGTGGDGRGHARGPWRA